MSSSSLDGSVYISHGEKVGMEGQ